jgi:uncharacterized repeat protein (TIGR03803 family)
MMAGNRSPDWCSTRKGTLGTTSDFGTGDLWGTVFQLGLSTNRLTTLCTFTGGADGGAPRADLLYSNGWLYGTTSVGASDEEGTVYALNAESKRFFVLHTFTGGDGEAPECGVVFGTVRCTERPPTAAPAAMASSSSCPSPIRIALWRIGNCIVSPATPVAEAPMANSPGRQ